MPWTLAVVLTILAPLAAINYFVGRKIFRALAQVTSWDRTRLRLLCIIVHVFFNLLPVAFFVDFLVSGRASAADFSGDIRIVDYLFSYPFWLALVIILQLFVIFLLVDAIEWSILRYLRAADRWWKCHSSSVLIVVTCIVAVYSAATVIIDTSTVRVVEHKVDLPAGFQSLRGLRIAEISDVQGDGRTNYQDLRAYVSKVNSLHPDIVVFAGDLVTSGTRYIDSTAKILGLLTSNYGTFAAFGDHDIWSGKGLILKALKENGVSVLDDTTVTLSIDSKQIALSGVTFTYPEQPSEARLDNLLPKGMAGYRIMLVHQPAESLVRFAQRCGYRLFLAGHTHGGGIGFGVPGVLVVAPASLETRYVSGLYRAGDMLISVTNGLGLTLAPIRFHAPAEIVMLELY